MYVVLCNEELGNMSNKSKSDKAHLKRIKNMDCIACELMDPPVYGNTPCDAHHIHGYHGFCGKAPDTETLPLCKIHHQTGPKGVSYHGTARKDWEATFKPQYELLDIVRERLGIIA